MRCLVASDDPLVRDQVATAALAFTGLAVDAADITGCRNMLRRRVYDFAFVSLRSGVRQSEALWQEIRDVAPDLTLVAMTPRTGMAVRKTDRSRFDLFALIGTPIDAVEVFRTLRRLKDRLRKSGLVPAAARE